MKRFIALLVCSLLASSALSPLGWAQVADEPIRSPVKLKLTTFSDGRSTGSVSATLAGSTVSAEGMGPLSTSTKTIFLEIGKPYNLVIDSENAAYPHVYITPPPGFVLTIDGQAKTYFRATDAADVRQIRIFPFDDTSARPAGAASSITGGRVKWEVALGAMRNGNTAGSLLLSGAGTSSWAAFFTPAALYYDTPSEEEIYVYRINGDIRQISATEAFLDVITLDGTSYELRFYHPAQVPTGSYPKTAFTGLPFVVYRISKDSNYKLRIIKETRSLASAADTTSAIARTEWTTIQRSGTSPAYTWTVSDWTVSGQPAQSIEKRTWSARTGGGHNELIEVLESDDTAVSQVTREHPDLPWGDTPTSTTVGTNASATTDTLYNTTSSDEGSYGFIKSTTSTGGAWQRYEYFSTSDDLKAGTISKIYAPFINAPANISTDPTQGTVTTLTYVEDAFGMLRRPATSETKINDVLTAKTLISYSNSVANGKALVVATKSSHSKATNPLVSVCSYYREDTEDEFFRNQPHAVIKADRTAQSFIRQRGTLSGTTFTAGATGKASRIGTISGVADNVAGTNLISTYDDYTIQSVYLVPNKSTLDFVIRDRYARVARTESYVWNGSAWQLVSWINFTYNFNNQLTSRVASNGDTYNASYSGELKQWERDGTGIKIYYTYDNAGRVWKTTKEGANGLPDLITEYTYDAADRVTKQETYAASGSTEKLTTSRAYDKAGRIESETSPGVGVTTYLYDPVNRIETVQTPDSQTTIRTTYRDGQLKSITGTATVAQHYTYGVETDGRRWAQINLSSSSSVRWSKNWIDWLGRPQRIERPGFTGQSNYAEQHTYDSTTGQLVKTARSGGTADTRYVYNNLGQLILSGLDIDDNGSLDLASADRINGQETWFAYEGGAWWLANRSYTYATLNSSAETTLGSTRERLTGFTGDLRSESRVTDAEGNTSTTTVSADRSSRTVTKTTTAPGLSSATVATIINGLPTTSTAPDGITLTTGYDVLQRPATSSNVRAGVTRTATTTYELNTARPHTITDPAGTITATYGYDITGRQSWVKNAENKYVRFAYTNRGELRRQWGEATAPASFAYNSYGERTGLTTYRTDGVWTGENWPASPPSGDTTSWTFDGPSGLLQKKTDAQGRYVEYDYNSRGQVYHRYWSRTLDGTSGTDRVTATYAYDSKTGDPLSTTYNDSTPTTSTAYTRMGQVATLSDYTGTRTYDYDNAAPWRQDALTTPSFHGGFVFKSLYDTTTSASAGTVKGRARGFQLGTTSNPDLLLQRTYSMNSLGRLTGVTATRNDGAVSQGFAYGYLSGSRLVETLSATGTAFTTTRVYDPHRDLLTGITGKWSTATKSQFVYTHDALGRRVTGTQSGDAFAAYGGSSVQRFVYNSRGELTDAKGYLDAEATGNELPGRQFNFSYDAAGNRTSANHTGDPAKTNVFTVNSLNQLSTRTHKAVSVSGTAATDATVIADDQLPARRGRFWQLDLQQDPTDTAQVYTFSAIAAKTGAGAAGEDLAQVDRRFVFLPGYTESLTYDADGNLTSDAQWTYSWDAENRLVAMEAKPWIEALNALTRQRLEFRYDAMGRRVLKRVFDQKVTPGTWTLASETRFLYDGWNLLAEFSVVPGTGTLNLVRSYTWGLDLTGSLTASGGVGALLQLTDHATGVSYFPTYDGNGNVAMLVNASSGGLGAVYEYNAFGEPLRVTGAYAKTNPFRFSTKYTDNESGLVYYGFRYYNANNGRFINRDPIEERGGINLYGFCGNDGINRSDYLGQSFLSFLKKLRKKLTRLTRFIDPAAHFALRVDGTLDRYADTYPWLRVAGSLVAAYFTGGLSYAALGGANGGWIAVAGAGATSGATSSALQGGSNSDILNGAIIGAAGAYAGYTAVNSVPASWNLINNLSIPRAAFKGFVDGATSGALKSAIYGGNTLNNITQGAMRSALFTGLGETVKTLTFEYNAYKKSIEYINSADISPDLKQGFSTGVKAYIGGSAIAPSATALGALAGGGAGYLIGGDIESAIAGAFTGAVIGYQSSGVQINGTIETSAQRGSVLDKNLFSDLRELGLNVTYGVDHAGIYASGQVSAVPRVFGIPINSLSFNASGSISWDNQVSYSASHSMGDGINTNLPPAGMLRGSRPLNN